MTHVLSTTPRCARVLCTAALAGLSLLAACAKVTEQPGGSGGNGGHVSGTAGNNGTGNRAMGIGGSGIRPDSGAGDGAACQQASYSFVPKIPNVLVFVDGSGSMFDPATDLPMGRWGALRSALLPVIMNLQDQVNFGLAIFSGVMPSECPIFQTVPLAKSNYTAIMNAYPAGRLRPQSVALETPLAQSLPLIPPLFASAPKTGDSYVLFATDGEPDFCDNNNVVCPVDAAIAGIKKLKVDNNITTIVMGLTSNIVSSTCPGVLQGYANAGAAQPIANACPPHNVYDECNGYPAWKALAGNRGVGQALVDYATTGGTAKVYSPAVTDQQELTNTLAALFSGVKSCSFDLGNINGSSIKVDITQLNKATVKIENVVVPLDSTNGWKINCVTAPGATMCTNSQLELVGSACTNWRGPDTKNIDFNFPCDIIIPT